jgi:hypothetical protein
MSRIAKRALAAAAPPRPDTKTLGHELLELEFERKSPPTSASLSKQRSRPVSPPTWHATLSALLLTSCPSRCFQIPKRIHRQHTPRQSSYTRANLGQARLFCLRFPLCRQLLLRREERKVFVYRICQSSSKREHGPRTASSKTYSTARSCWLLKSVSSCR